MFFHLSHFDILWDCQCWSTADGGDMEEVVEMVVVSYEEN